MDKFHDKSVTDKPSYEPVSDKPHYEAVMEKPDYKPIVKTPQNEMQSSILNTLRQPTIHQTL